MAPPTTEPGPESAGPLPDPGPDEAPVLGRTETAGTLLIACGALAREIVQLIRLNRLDHLDVQCLPAKLHNRPGAIPDAVRAKIHANRGRYDRILVAYADCGTGGLLDSVLAEEKVERIGGPHCYAFYAGQAAFERLTDEEVGTFFLTDYMVRHFDRLIFQGLGLDRHPHLRDDYFQHYKRVVYLAQTEDPALQSKAREAADRLQLAYEFRLTGLNELGAFIEAAKDG